MMNQNKPTPLVSVIIPTYNRAWIVREAIESVLDQDYSNFELIVVDDGSTDNTVEILNAYSSSLSVIHQENKGVSAARNIGISHAKGKFISFLDSDDTWLKKKLSTQIDFFSAHEDALICQTEEIWIRNGKRVNPKKYHKKQSGMIFDASLFLCLVSPSAVMMHRNFFDQVGLFDESLLSCEDYDLWLRASCKMPVYLVDTPLIVKRGGHHDQLSKAWGLDRYRIKSLKKIIESGLLSDDQCMKAQEVFKEKCHIYSEGCLKRKKKKEADYYLSLIDQLPSLSS